jgi:hypothetical protein
MASAGPFARCPWDRESPRGDCGLDRQLERCDLDWRWEPIWPTISQAAPNGVGATLARPHPSSKSLKPKTVRPRSFPIIWASFWVKKGEIVREEWILGTGEAGAARLQPAPTGGLYSLSFAHARAQIFADLVEETGRREPTLVGAD